MGYRTRRVLGRLTHRACIIDRGVSRRGICTRHPDLADIPCNPKAAGRIAVQSVSVRRAADGLPDRTNTGHAPARPLGLREGQRLQPSTTAGIHHCARTTNTPRRKLRPAQHAATA
jgi:hypothetical protein